MAQRTRHQIKQIKKEAYFRQSIQQIPAALLLLSCLAIAGAGTIHTESAHARPSSQGWKNNPEKLIEKIQQNPKGEKLLEQAVAKTELSSPKEFIKKYVGSFEGDDTGSHQKLGYVPARGGLSITARRSPASATRGERSSHNRVRQADASNHSAPKDRNQSPRIERKAQATAVCLRENLTLAQGARTTIHELTHFVDNQFFKKLDLNGIESDEDYYLKLLQAEGNELDAHINGIKFEIQDKGIADVALPYRDFFNEEGEFTGNEREFAKTILKNGYQDQVQQSLKKDFELSYELYRKIKSQTPEQSSPRVERTRERLAKFCDFSDLDSIKGRCSNLALDDESP